jgi:hypothetical protein
MSFNFSFNNFKFHDLMNDKNKIYTSKRGEPIPSNYSPLPSQLSPVLLHELVSVLPSLAPLVLAAVLITEKASSLKANQQTLAEAFNELTSFSQPQAL